MYHLLHFFINWNNFCSFKWVIGSFLKRVSCGLKHLQLYSAFKEFSESEKISNETLLKRSKYKQTFFTVIVYVFALAKVSNTRGVAEAILFGHQPVTRLHNLDAILWCLIINQLNMAQNLYCKGIIFNICRTKQITCNKTLSNWKKTFSLTRYMH